MNEFVRRIAIAVITILALLLLLRATSPDQKYNLASFEKNHLQSAMLPTSDGWTLAQMVDSSGMVRTILVVDFDSKTITGIDLQSIGAIDSSGF
ncbi:MAG: hypothetical protein ACI9LY_000847 [Arenicella sp.]|jgi:hypothetical protein